MVHNQLHRVAIQLAVLLMPGRRINSKVDQRISESTDIISFGNHYIEISPIKGKVPGSNRRSLRYNTRHAERRLVQMELHRLFIVQQLDLHTRTQPIVLQVARRVHKVLDSIAILQVDHLQ